MVSVAGADGLDQLCERQPSAEPAGVSLGLDEIAPDWFVAGVEFEHESDWPAAIGCGHALSVAARAGLRIGEDPLSFRLLAAIVYVAWVLVGDGQTPRVSSTAGAVLLERDEELAVIDRWLSDAGEGRGRIALVLGGAGLGKSALLDQAAGRAATGGLAVLRARGSELERGLPFGLATQLFASTLRNLSEADQRALFSGAAARARGPLGLKRGVSGGDLFGALHGLYWLLANLSDRSPLLLTVDDLHWGDSQTRRWLGYLHPRVSELPVLLLGAARPDETDQDQLVAGVPVERVSTVVVRPFSEGAVVRLAREQFEGVDEPEFAVACHRATGGNPFFVRELLRAAAADGIQPTAANVGLVPQLGSSAIARSIVVRLARLGGSARDLADAVAVLGANAELRHAAVLAGLSTDQALTAWDALAVGEILEPRQPLEFIHPIARTAIYLEMPVGKRGRAHRRAAEMLSADGAGAQQVGLQAVGMRAARRRSSSRLVT